MQHPVANDRLIQTVLCGCRLAQSRRPAPRIGPLHASAQDCAEQKNAVCTVNEPLLTCPSHAQRSSAAWSRWAASRAGAGAGAAPRSGAAARRRRGTSAGAGRAATPTPGAAAPIASACREPARLTLARRRARESYHLLTHASPPVHSTFKPCAHSFHKSFDTPGFTRSDSTRLQPACDSPRRNAVYQCDDCSYAVDRRHDRVHHGMADSKRACARRVCPPGTYQPSSGQCSCMKCVGTVVSGGTKCRELPFDAGTCLRTIGSADDVKP